MAVLQFLREQTELADSDRHGRGLSNPPILPIMFIPSSVPRTKSGALRRAKSIDNRFNARVRRVSCPCFTGSGGADLRTPQP